MRVLLSILGLSVALLLLVSSGVAATTAFRCDGSSTLSAAARERTLEAVQRSYSQLTSLRAQFFQDSFLGALGVSELSAGTVVLSKPGKMRWDYERPETQVFTVKDETLWLYQREENQVLIDNFRDVLISDLPVSFLMGIGDLKRDFSVSSACKNPDGVVLSLSPRGTQASGKTELKTLELLVHPTTFLLQGARVSDVAGNTTAILLREIEPNIQIDDESFEVSFPTGVDVSDRRTKESR